MKKVYLPLLALLIVACSNEEKSVEKHEEATKSVAKVKEVKTLEKKIVAKSESIKPVSPKKVEVKAVETQELEKKVVPKEKVAAKPQEKPLSVDGSKVFSRCTSCHGTHAEKKALNKSQIIKGWSSSKIITALNGYKDGTYGSSMKGVMKAQVAKLSDGEIKAVAEHISKF